MKKLINKKIVLSIFVFGLFFINTNNSNAQYYVSSNEYNYAIPVTVAGPEVNNLPLCDSTYRLHCPFNVRCRNINGMIAFACPAAYANQPANSYYDNSYLNNTNNNTSYVYTNYVNNTTNYTTDYNSYYYDNSNNIGSNYRFVNSPVYFENGAYYTNPVIRPSYELNPTQNQVNNYFYYSHNYHYTH